MFDKINEIQYKQLGYFTRVLMADYLSNKMLAESHKEGSNLNQISH
jgi:hypothetical protein